MTKFLWPIDLTGNPINNFRIENLATAPSPGKAGRLVYLTSTATLIMDTGDAFVSLSEQLSSVADGSITNSKLANIPTATVKGRVASGSGVPKDLSMSELKGILGLTVADIANLSSALDDKAPVSHNHLAAQISDLASVIDSRVVAYWDSIAGTDANVDTIREVLDLILANQSSLADVIRRHNQTIGDGATTSITVAHNLNSLDVLIEVFEISSGATVITDVVRTNANVVTLNFAVAPVLDSLRVIIKK